MKKFVMVMVIMGMLFMTGVASAAGSSSSKGKNGDEDFKMATAHVDLKDSSGNSIGYVTLQQKGDKVKVHVNAWGLTPGLHGFHIHQNPITENDFATAGGHFNPDGRQHGHGNPQGAHAGDLPNIKANKAGHVNHVFFVEGISLEKGKANSILGRSFIIHEVADDNVSDPAGNAGARIAWGNIPTKALAKP